jgi:hypothetical protein
MYHQLAFVYRCIHRLHDIIYFLWVEKWVVAWFFLKCIGYLAATGFVIAVLAEIKEQIFPAPIVERNTASKNKRPQQWPSKPKYQ